MTAKARRILARLKQQMQEKKTPEGAPYNAQEMTLLKDMNAMEDEHEKHMDGLKGAE